MPTTASEPHVRDASATTVGRLTLKERVLRAYFRFKYAAFQKEKREPDGRRGLIVFQIDALSHSDLRRAIELGYVPTIRRLLQDDYVLRRWFCGLPSATPYAQAG